MRGRADIKQVGLLSLYGLSLVWSPIFGTSEAMVFPALTAFPQALLASRVCNLAAFGIVMGVFSALGERLRGLGEKQPFMWVLMAFGCMEMLCGAFAGMEILTLPWLIVGAFVRGLFYGMLTVLWIDVLVHLDHGTIGVAVSAALALYACTGLPIALLAPSFPVGAAISLALCPVLSCIGCMNARNLSSMQEPVDQEGATAPFRTRCLLYAANFLFSIMLGALLYYFSRYDTPGSIAVFFATSAVLFAVFAYGGGDIDTNTVYRGFMMVFAIGLSLALLLGWLDPLVCELAASAALAFLILYTVVIFIDTQARMRNPYWKVPGACQVFAALGMIIAAMLFQIAFPEGELPDAYLVLLAAACIIFVVGVFSPSSRTRVRPWGFSSLIPAESPEARALRRCGELAEECSLTSRELEILQQLAAGMTKDEIAETLCISPSTAKTHIRNIYAKLDVHSQRELTQRIDS